MNIFSGRARAVLVYNSRLVKKKGDIFIPLTPRELLLDFFPSRLWNLFILWQHEITSLPSRFQFKENNFTHKLVNQVYRNQSGSGYFCKELVIWRIAYKSESIKLASISRAGQYCRSLAISSSFCCSEISSEFKRKTTELDLRGVNDNRILTLIVKGIVEKLLATLSEKQWFRGLTQKNRNTE